MVGIFANFAPTCAFIDQENEPPAEIDNHEIPDKNR